VAKTRIGLDIGATAVRAAEVSTNGSAALVRAAQVPLEPKAVENGEIRNPEAVAEAVRELWSAGRFKSHQVHMGVANQRVVVREVALPWLPPKELQESIAYQVQEYIPIPVDDAVLDFDPLDEFEHEGRRMLRILLVAAQKAMVSSLVDTAVAAKLEPVGVDLVPFALLRSVGDLADGRVLEDSGEEAVVDIGADVTSICVHDRGMPRFVRILPSGGNDITLAVARALGVSEEEADRMKRGEALGTGGPNPEDAQRVATGRTTSFVDEIRSSLEFYAAQSPGSRVTRLTVTGGGSKLQGFMELLGERVAATVDRGHVFGRVTPRLNLTDDALAEAEPLLAVAVGLALPGGRG
jgi:type IV pilus assembly protein PilM